METPAEAAPATTEKHPAPEREDGVLPSGKRTRFEDRPPAAFVNPPPPPPGGSSLPASVRSAAGDGVALAINKLSPTVIAKVNSLYAMPGVEPYDLEACCFDSMKDFDETQCIAIVDKFLEAGTQGRLSSIRSKTAFFIGILKRFRADAERGAQRDIARSLGGYSPGMLGGRSAAGDEIAQAINKLSPTVIAKVNSLYAMPGVAPYDLEVCCIDSLKDFDDTQCIAIVDKFLEADFSAIRNKTAFFIGILKRFRAEKSSAPAAPAAGGFPPPAFMFPPPPPPFLPAGWEAAPITSAEDQEREAAMNRLPYSVRQRIELLYAALDGAYGGNARKDIAPCCIDSLKDFDEVTCCDIIDKLNQADWSTVRNRTAFFIGVLKRYRANPSMGGGGGEGGALQGSGAVAPPPPPSVAKDHGPPAGLDEKTTAMTQLAPSVRQKLEDMFACGDCRLEDLEPCCIDSLKDFNEETAHEIVDKFFEADMSTIRNKTAYFIGVLKRYRGPNSQASGGAQPAGGVQPAAAVPDWSAYANMFQANMLMLQAAYGAAVPTAPMMPAAPAAPEALAALAAQQWGVYGQPGAGQG